MTHLEQVIRDVTTQTTVTTLSAATAKIAEDMARELLRDPAVKAELLQLVRKALADTWTSMNQPVIPPTPPTP